MTNRLATRIGLPVPEERPADTRDVLRFREPAVGAEVRTKGSLFLLAQVTGGDAAVGRAAAQALEALEHDYYYDLSAGALGALGKALANRIVPELGPQAAPDVDLGHDRSTNALIRRYRAD